MIAKRILVATAVVLVACSGGAGSGGAVAPVQMSDAHRIAIADSITRTLSAFTQAVASLDADKIASFYSDSPEMRWVEDGEVRYHSRRDVAQAIRSVAGTMTSTSLTYNGTEVMPVAPGVASLVTGFAQKFTTVQADTGGFAGAITAVMVHEGDRWLFLTGHTSSVGNRSQ